MAVASEALQARPPLSAPPLICWNLCRLPFEMLHRHLMCSSTDLVSDLSEGTVLSCVGTRPDSDTPFELHHPYDWLIQ